MTNFRQITGLIALAALFAFSGSALAGTAAPACQPLLSHTLPRLQDERPQSLCQYSGRVVLVVNTASFCGYTRQYEGLERLHARYAARGLVVLGFPSDSFRQEPRGNAEIAELCFNTYGVRFPMFAKSAVVGAQANPLFVQLAQASRAPQWNFHKYLIDRQGRVVVDFPSAIEPLDARLTAQIEKLLAAR